MSAFLATVQFQGRPRAKVTTKLIGHVAPGGRPAETANTSNAQERINRSTENSV